MRNKSKIMKTEQKVVSKFLFDQMEDLNTLTVRILCLYPSRRQCHRMPIKERQRYYIQHNGLVVVVDRLEMKGTAPGVAEDPGGNVEVAAVVFAAVAARANDNPWTTAWQPLILAAHSLFRRQGPVVL